MSTVDTTGIIGGAESFATAQKTATNKVADDKEMFLKLLVTQLSNQDPLNPVEDKEFITQLAQFTSVEELQKINSGIGTMVDTAARTELVNAVSFVGKTVIAEGTTVTKYNSEDGTAYATSLFYTNDVEMVQSKVTIIDDSGAIIYAENLGAQAAGEHPYSWNCKNFDGIEVAKGNYEAIVSGVDADGKSVLIRSEVFGDVIGVESKSGQNLLLLDGGRTVDFTKVKLVGLAQ